MRAVIQRVSNAKVSINGTEASIINHGRPLNKFDHEPDFKIEYNMGTAIFCSIWEESFSHYSIELLSHSGRLFYDQGGRYIEWQSISEDPDFQEYKILDKNKISSEVHIIFKKN